MEPLPPIDRVVLTGSECTGKSTLARALAAHYRTSCSIEFAREYLARKDAPLSAADVEPIARGQVHREDAAIRRARGVAILDTDLVSTVIYARHYYGRCPLWIERAARARRAELYLLHHPDVPWAADGLHRDRPDRREAMHELFRQALAELGASVADVRGSWPERREAAVAAVDALLARR